MSGAGHAGRAILCLLWLTAPGSPAATVSSQARIDAAPAGAEVRVPAGVHPGRLVLRKPVRLIGEGVPHLLGEGQGRVVEILAPHVTLRGFRISGSGFNLSDDDAAVFIAAEGASVEENEISSSLHGIYLKRAHDCRVVRNRIRGAASANGNAKSAPEEGLGGGECDAAGRGGVPQGNGIHLWSSQRAELIGNEIEGGREGIYFSFSDDCRVEGNRVRGVRYGLHYMYSNRNRFSRNEFSESAAGAAAMFSRGLEILGNRFVGNRGSRAYGLILQSVDDARVEGNRIERNAVGLALNQCNRNRVMRNRVGWNYIGLRCGSNSDGNAFSLNRFVGNLHPVEASGHGEDNRWAVAGLGNVWDGAPRLDWDGDGISELPHRELDLFGVLRRDFPVIGLLSESPVLRGLRFAHQRAALPGVRCIQDPAPLAPHHPAAHGPVALAAP